MDGDDDSDVLVVGGGPAGCAAAITCRRAGLRVRLVDPPGRRGRQPGEALAPGAEPVLRALGVWADVEAEGFVRYPGHWVQWGADRRFQAFGEDANGPWLGMQAWRPVLDDIMRRAARRAGVLTGEERASIPLVDQGRVRGVVADGRPLRARMSIDASGSAHWLARRLSLPVVAASPPLVAWYGYRRGEPGEASDCPELAGDASGWTWTARVRHGLHQWVRLPLDGARVGPDWCPPALASLVPTGPRRGADVTWRHVPASAGDGYVIAGDAAFTLDPLSSHGVLRALLSGIAAGELAVGTLRGVVSPSWAAAAYRRWQTEWFLRDTRALRALYAALPGAPAWATGHSLRTPVEGDATETVR